MDTKALRQKILDLAIRGKLVPQDPNDEPASVLLERIRAEKQQMVKDGKLKPKDIKNDTIIFVGEDNLHYEKFQDGTVKCIEDEIPFEVPEGWEWCRLGNITDTIQYGLSNSAESTGTHRLLRITDIQEGKVNWDTVPFTKTNEPDKYTLHINDIVFARTGATVGKSFLITKLPYESVYASYLIRIRLIGNVSPQYIYQFFNSRCYWEQITGKAVGVGQPNCNGTALKELFIPLPPINEQKQIVPTAESLLKYADAISNEEEQLINLISSAKSKILDLAIRGKLVPQDSNDEPASVLLERIRAEKEKLIKAGKIKRDKKESIIFRGEDNSYYEIIDGQTELINNEIPFELPDNWEWVRLSSVMSLSSGKAIKIRQLTDDGEFPVYGGNGINGLYSEYNVDSNAIIIGRVGYYCGSVYKTDRKAWVTDNALIATIKEPNIFNIDFLVAILKYLDLGKTSVSTAQPVVSGKGILPLIVPVPPFNEQILINSTLQKVNSHVLQVESELL